MKFFLVQSKPQAERITRSVILISFLLIHDLNLSILTCHTFIIPLLYLKELEFLKY